MEYKRVKMMNDKRWTNAIKCDIMKTIADFIEVQNKNRQEEFDVIFEKQKQYLEDLKLSVYRNRLVMKEGINDFKDKMLSNTNRILLERYRCIHPDEIKSSMKRAIHHINYEENNLITRINQKKNELGELNNVHVFQYKSTINHSQRKGIMKDLASIDDRIRLANFSKTKMKKMVNLAQQHLNKYDSLLEQVHNDMEEMATNLMNEIEIGAQFKRDTHKCTQQLKNEMLASKEKRIKQIDKIEQLNTKFDSMARVRKTLLSEKPPTELEVAFRSELPFPWTFEENLIPVSSSSKISSSSDNKKTDWYSKMLQFGVNYFIDEDEKNNFLTNLENEDNTSTMNYRFPADIIDYINFNDLSQKKDKIALNYLRKKLKFKTIEDLIHFAERTKYDLTKLNAFKAIRETVWKLILKKNIQLQEATENVNLMTNNDIEFYKQEKTLNSYIDEQRKKISKLKESKDHYSKLFNDMCFYMDNLNSILQPINISDVYIKPDHYPYEKKLEIPDIKMAQLIKDTHFLVTQIDIKVKHCTAMFTNKLSTEQMNMARAVYISKVQEHIQENILKEQMELKRKKLKRVEDIPMPPKVILSREETKKQADRVLKYIEEKDTDKSKNKRKPISFRRSYM